MLTNKFPLSQSEPLISTNMYSIRNTHLLSPPLANSMEMISALSGCHHFVLYKTKWKSKEIKYVAILFGSGGHPEAAESTFNNSVLMKTIQKIFQ